MFAYVCGGRPVETNIQQIEETKFVFTVNDAAKINYISIFLLPGAQISNDLAAAVYAQLPGQQEFHFLGALTSVKQSVIFKLNNTTSAIVSNDVDEMMDEDDVSQSGTSAVITFGISIESLAQVEQNLAAKRQEANRRKPLTLPSSGTSLGASADPTNSANGITPAEVQSIAAKVVGHAYNFLASFVDPQGNVPIKSFQSWWTKFKSRLQSDPNFIQSLEEM
ncbi:Opi10 protein [Starmerella bacillaris]|uniref:Opi10 protein n=1 Tax=Starmerella bacillaris TaxID=1247836 RepID=A0AAV5RQH6_STABA|nr:Opi10 protein [Starmerella bacillaris]